MKSKLITVNMITGAYVDLYHSHTMFTIRDDSGRPRPNIITNDYTCYIPFYAPKGVTDTFMLYEGDDVLSKFEDMHGLPNTNIYGPNFTMARKALEAGFRLGCINIAPPEATHANFYVAFDMKNKLTEAGELETQTLFVEYDSVGDHYHMSFLKETLPNLGTVNEIVIPRVEATFSPFTIEDCTADTDVDQFLSETVFKLNVSKGDTITKEDVLHMPLFGLVYRGRSSYGNNFVANFRKNSTLVNDKYHWYNTNIYDTMTKQKEFEWNFTLFNVSNSLGNSVDFFNTATAATTVSMKGRNVIEVHRPYMIEKGQANMITKAVRAYTEKYKMNILKKIKEVYPQFDEVASSSDFYMIEDTFTILNDLFTKASTKDAVAIETPFSFIDIFDKGLESTFSDTCLEFKVAPTAIQFAGGNTGELESILNEEGWSWDIEVPHRDDTPDESEVEYIVSKPSTLSIGRDTKVTVKYKVKERPMCKFFKDELAKCYTGEISEAIFDPVLLPDALVIGEDYPNELQKIVADFVKYRYLIQDFDRSRPDCTYWRTNSHKEVKTIADAIEWARSFPLEENLRMIPMIGSFVYDDDTTGGTNRFSPIYEYLGSDGSLLPYLKSVTSDSFSSGSYSVIYKGKPNSHRLIPKNKEEREELHLLDVMYFTLNGDRMYKLANDVAWKPGMLSDMKSLGSSIQWGRIIREAGLIMRDRQNVTISPEVFADIKNALVRATETPAKHFGGRLNFTVGLSDHVNEIGQDIIYAKAEVQGNKYANRNRIEFVSIPRTNEN